MLKKQEIRSKIQGVYHHSKRKSKTEDNSLYSDGSSVMQSLWTKKTKTKTNKKCKYSYFEENKVFFASRWLEQRICLD
jgi:homoserine trans-succinylase